MQDRGGLYDREQHVFCGLGRHALLAACAPPGGARQPMSQRVTRHFHPIYMPAPPEATLRSIFEQAAASFFTLNFAADLGPSLLKSVVSSTVDMFAAVSAQLLPTPFKPHYTFNLRDLTKVFLVRPSTPLLPPAAERTAYQWFGPRGPAQLDVACNVLMIRRRTFSDVQSLRLDSAQCGMQGITSVDAQSCATDPLRTVAELWLHECLRVFHDRLTDPADQRFVQRELHGYLAKRFGVQDSFEEVFEGDAQVHFASFAKLGVPLADRAYVRVKGAPRAVRALAG